ncbi:MAG: TlpA disulfide reductase family protein [Elusimicrobiota bacterium]
MTSFSGRTLSVPAALFALLLAAGCTPPGDGSGGDAGLGEPAPEFALKDLTGRIVRLADFKGKVVLIDFWATYCLPCRDAIPELQALHDKHQAEGFAVIGISVDAYAGHVPDFVRELGVKYPVVLDPEQETARSFGFSQLPTTFLVDRSGRIRRKWLGYDPAIAEEIHREVAAALQDKGTS